MKTSTESNAAALVSGKGILLALACSALTRCHNAPPPTRQQAAPAQGIQVTLLIYSGRPNPTWTIEDAASLDRVRTSLASARDLAEFKGESVLPSVLGYNGFLISNPSKAGALPATLAVYRDRIEVRDGKPRFLTDGGALETWLIEQARARNLIGEREMALIRPR